MLETKISDCTVTVVCEVDSLPSATAYNLLEVLNLVMIVSHFWSASNSLQLL